MTYVEAPAESYRLSQAKQPRLARYRRQFGIPARYRKSSFGEALGDTDLVPVLIRLWIRHAANGEVIRPSSALLESGIELPLAGQGIVIVGGEQYAQEYTAAIVNDLLRQPVMQQSQQSLSDDWLRWLTAGEVHKIMRSDDQSEVTKPSLLVITDVPHDDKWVCRSIATLLAQRQRVNCPAIIAMSWEAHRALRPESEEIGSLDGVLSGLLDRQLVVVL